MKENPKVIDLDTVDVKNNNTKKANAIIDLDGEPTGIATSKSQYDKGQVLSDNNTLENLNQQRGQLQPWYDKAANGVVNMAGRTVTSAAEGILNPFIGTFYAIKDGKASSYIDNPFTSLIDNADKQIKEAVPFYQTKEEENAHGLSKLAYGNTYFRDVLDGVGFSLGAMATGGVYNKIINTLGKTALVGKTGDFINKLNTIDAAPDKLKYIDQVNTLNSVKDGAKKGLIAGFTATAESEMNARSDAKEFKTARIKEIIDSGRQPSNEELAQIDSLSEEILTSSFALNMPIIMLDNWITFGKSVFGNKVTDKLNLTEIGDKVTKEGFNDTYKLAKKASIDKVLDKTYGVRKFVEPMISEGFFQEQSQYGITKGVNDYYKKKFYNPEAADFIESFGEGVYQAYGTKEGWDNGIIGALSGGAMGNVTTLATEGRSAYSNPNNITSVPSQLSNLSTVKSYKTLVEKAMRHGNLMEEQKQALKNNDTFTYENAKNDDFINYAGTKIAYGKTQDLLDELNEFKSMSEEEFKSNFGNELSTDEITKSKQTVSQFVQEKINKVQQIKRAYDIINEKFPNASEGNKERLAYASLTIDNAKERKSKLNQEAKQLLTKNIHFTGNLGDTNPLMLLGNDYLSLSKENKKLYKKALLDANMNPMDLDETLDKLVDIDKLEAREEQFVKEYKELTKPHVQAANDVVDKKAETKIVEEQSKPEQEFDNEETIFTTNYGELINKATSSKELDKILEQADKEELTNPELVDLISKKRESLKPVNTNNVQLNKDEVIEEVDDTEVLEPEISNELYPNTRTITSDNKLTNNKKRDEISELTKGELLSSSEVQELINKEGNNINDLITIDAVQYKDKKSVRIKIGDRVLGYFQDSQFNSSEINQLINGIKIDDKLFNKQLKDLGFNLNVSNGFIKPSDTAISIGALSSIVKTNNDYVIFDQGTNKYRNEGNDPILIRDAKGAVQAGEIIIPNAQRRLGRYILSFNDETTGKQKFIPIAPSKLEDYNKYLSSLITLSNKVVKGDENGKFTNEQIAEFNSEINDKVFIALDKSQLKGKSIEADINIDQYGNIRVNLNEVFYDSKIPDKSIYKLTVKNSELSQFKSTDDLLNYINELTTANAGISITAKSFRNSIPKGELVGNVEDKFETYTAPEVLEGQDVLISINKTNASLNTVEPELAASWTEQDIQQHLKEEDLSKPKEETRQEKRAREAEERKNTKLNKDDDNNESPAFRLSDTQIDDLISDKETSETTRILPKEIEVQTKKDLREFIQNINTTKTPWGFFKNKIIYLATNAGSGTSYHEAFHAIFRYSIGNEDVKRYLKLAEKEVLTKLNTKEKLDKALTELRANSMDYSDLSEQQIYDLLLEEHMADRFMEWKKNKDLNTSTGLKQLFRRIWNSIKELFRINDSLETFFTKIDLGAFSSTKAVPNKQTFVSNIVYKNLISGKNTNMSSSKSKKIINTYAAKVKNISRNWNGESDSPMTADILEGLIKDRIFNLNTHGFAYVDSLSDRALADKLEQAITEELFTLEVPEAKELLVEQVKKRLELFDNKVNESTEDEEGENNDKGGETGFGSKEAWTISLEEGTNKVIREYIAFAMYETIDELTNQSVSIAVDAQTVYNGLGHVLANTPEDKMMDKFIVYSKDNVQAKAVLDMIMSDTGMTYDEQGLISHPKKNFNDLRKIITAFKNVKITFLHTEFNPTFFDGVLTSNKVLVYNANQNTAEKISISEWSNNLFNIRSNNETNKEYWNKRINSVVNKFRENKDVIVSEKQLDVQIKEVQNKFKEVGIRLSSGYIRYSILSYKEQFNSLSEEQLNNISVFKDDVDALDLLSISGEPSGFSMLQFLIDGKDPYEGGDDNMGNRMATIAKNNGIFDESLAASNFKGADGNTRYDIIKGSYVLDETIRLRSKDYRTKLAEKYEILKDNLLLKNDTLLNNLTINLIDGVRDHTKNDSEGKVFGDFSEREYLMQHLGYWFAQDKSGANFLFRQNEASNTAYIAKMPINKYTTNNIINDDVVDTVYSFFKAEYNRIGREQTKGLGNIKGYNDKATGRAFRFTEFSNLLNTIGPAKYNQITENAKINEKLSDELVKDVKKAIRESLTTQVVQFKQLLADNNLILLTNGVVTQNKILPNKLKGKTLEGLELDVTIAEMYLNDYVNSFSLNQLFDGDYALSRDDKGILEKYYTFEGSILKEVTYDTIGAVKVLVPKQDMSIDIVKRHKGAMGSGSDLGNGNHRVAFIKDINVFVDGKKDGQLIRSDKGDKINSNDAQSYTNINHIIFMAERLGRMSNDVKSILRKIRRGITITSKEQLVLEAAGANLNPWKTVTFGREFYVKTSEALISRHEVSYITDMTAYNELMDELEFMEDTKELSKEALIEFNKELIALYQPIPGKEYYHKMLNQMDVHGIDQIVAESASKGMTLSPQDSLLDDLDLSKSMIDIPNSYKRLQVETPTGKNTITAGTQLMQLIDSEQNDATIVNVNGTNISIGDVRKQYRTAMSKTRENSFKLAEAYIRKNADGSTDTSKLKVKFIKALESSGADEQLLEIFNLNWNLLPAIDKAEQLFLSHFGGGVLAQKVPGTKVSLMSDAHWNVVVDENDKVVLNKTVKTNNVKYSVYKTRKLLHNARDPKTGQLYSECVLSEKVFSKFGLSIGDEIPVDVATMLGYRIPTQDKHSMIALRVVDVLPNYLEGTGIFPSEIVLLSGADFDIDSLFIQQPSFWMDKHGVAVKSGTETTAMGRWLGFLSYIGNDKMIDGEINNRLNNTLGYRELSSIKKKNRSKEENEQLTSVRDGVRRQTLAYFNLPTNATEFDKLFKDGVDVNNNILNNTILDSELALLTNKAIEDIALTPVTSDPLVVEAEYIQSLKEGQSKQTVSSSSLLGKSKAFFQNSAGKAGIGPVANALQAFTFLAKNGITRRVNSIKSAQNNKLSASNDLIINNKELIEFKYTNEEGNRVADTLSTILSVMTDNAKDPIAGKMGLSLEILTAYNYLISLGVPLRTVSLIINTPSVQMYAKLLKENNYGIKTEAEKKGTRSEKLNVLFFEILGQPIEFDNRNPNVLGKPIDTSSLEQVIKEGLNDTNRDLNFDMLISFLQIENESKAFQDLNNLIKLTKGLPTSFTDVDRGLIDSLYNLGLADTYDLPTRDNVSEPIFDIREAVKNDNLLDTNIKSALQVIEYAEGVFITETNSFKEQYKKLLLNLKSNLTKDAAKELKRSFLGFITTKAYIKYMKTREFSPIADFDPTNDNLLFPELGGETLAKELIKLKNSKNESISGNSFIRWLKPELNLSIVESGEENSKAVIDKVSGKSFIKLSTESINDIVNSFQDLYKNPETNKFAIDSFHYLITKDNLEYKNDSFVKYIAPFMFNSISNGLNSQLKDLSLGVNNGEFRENSEEFRLILASYKPTQSYLKQVKLPKTVDSKANSFKSEMVFDFKSSEDLFESRMGIHKQIEYKYPEFIIARIGSNTELYYNDLQGVEEDWGINALYKKLPSFGYKNVSVFGKDYNANLNTYIALEQLKKQDKEGLIKKDPVSDVILDSEDVLNTPIPKQSKTNIDNNLDNSDKKTILGNNEIVNIKGKPPINLTGENNC